MEATLFFRQNRAADAAAVWRGPTPDWSYSAEDFGPGPASVFFHAKADEGHDGEAFVRWTLEFLAKNELAIREAINDGWDPSLTFVVAAANVRPGGNIGFLSAESSREFGRWGIPLGVYFD
jgi:hypothetical protein